MAYNDDISDNEIRIIGVDNVDTSTVESNVNGGDQNEPVQRPRNKWKWFAIGLILLILIVLSCLLTLFHSNNKRIVVEEIVDTIQAVSDKTETAEMELKTKASLTIREDTINDINLIIFTPEGYKAELKVGAIDTLDKSIMLCAQAADIRSDNGEIVSAYVLDGEPLSRGIAKKGFCAIIDDAITLGMAEETPLYERVVESKGDFFRQYPLVHDSQMQENKPKGKAIRNALCILNGKVCVIRSANIESFHDFAQALQDIGVTEAISLTGSNATFIVNDNDGNFTNYGTFEKSYENINYIIFRKKSQQ